MKNNCKLILFEDEREFVLVQGNYNCLLSCVWNNKVGAYDLFTVAPGSKDMQDFLSVAKENWFSECTIEDFIAYYGYTSLNADEIGFLMNEIGKWYVNEKK